MPDTGGRNRPPHTGSHTHLPELRVGPCNTPIIAEKKEGLWTILYIGHFALRKSVRTFENDECKGSLWLNKAEQMAYSWRKATIGSTLAARIAGYNPKIMPMPALINKGMKILVAVITVGMRAK